MMRPRDVKPYYGPQPEPGGDHFHRQVHVPSGLSAEGRGPDLDELSESVKAELTEKVEAWEKAPPVDLPIAHVVTAPNIILEPDVSKLSEPEYLEKLIRAALEVYDGFRNAGPAEQAAVVDWLRLKFDVPWFAEKQESVGIGNALKELETFIHEKMTAPEPAE
jgi:hypothetical protein